MIQTLAQNGTEKIRDRTGKQPGGRSRKSARNRHGIDPDIDPKIDPEIDSESDPKNDSKVAVPEKIL